MKKILFAILFAAPVLLFAQFNAQKDPFITKSLSSEKFSSMDVTTSHGNISVSKVPASEARVEVYIHANGNSWDQRISKEEIQQRLDQYYDMEVAVENGKLVAFARVKKNVNDNLFNSKKSLSISFRVYTADAMPTDLKTSHGDINLSSMSGDQELSTSHGNIRVESIAGSVSGGTSHGDVSVKSITQGVRMSTSHGNIEAEQCDGTIKVTTSNGDVRLKTLKGKVDAQTTHGNVDGDAVTGELTAATSHGDINLSNLDGPVATSTSHGNITLQLPKGKGMDIDLRGKKISVDKLENFSGSKEEKSMKGTLNGGGMIVKAETSQGDVNLRFR
ncbi:MAG: DUF4097 family beta strand repeat-containing protein [Bacteroidota bacterium]